MRRGRYPEYSLSRTNIRPSEGPFQALYGKIPKGPIRIPQWSFAPKLHIACGRVAWCLSPREHRARKAPSISYDVPDPDSDGFVSMDEYYLFFRIPCRRGPCAEFLQRKT